MQICFFSFTFSLHIFDFCIMNSYCSSGCQGNCTPVANGAGYNCACDANQTQYIPAPYDQCPTGCFNSSKYCACTLPLTTTTSPPTTTALHSGNYIKSIGFEYLQTCHAVVSGLTL